MSASCCAASVLGSVLILLAGCDRDRSCLEIVKDYQGAMPDAMVCEVGRDASCGAGRPFIVSGVREDGSVELEGICEEPCLGAVNPARTARVDDLLAEFDKAGCKRAYCWCPNPVSMPASCAPVASCIGMSTVWDP